jgi:hypothetical protein
MYVMHALPAHQQSLAGGIFNMLIRLSSTIALGISTAVYSSVKQAQGPDGDENTPFRMAYFVSVGLASLGCLFVPFLRMGTQGNSPAGKSDEADAGVVEPVVERDIPKDGEKLTVQPATWEQEDEEKRTIAGSITEKQ